MVLEHGRLHPLLVYPQEVPFTCLGCMNKDSILLEWLVIVALPDAAQSLIGESVHVLGPVLVKNRLVESLIWDEVGRSVGGSSMGKQDGCIGHEGMRVIAVAAPFEWGVVGACTHMHKKWGEGHLQLQVPASTHPFPPLDNGCGPLSPPPA